MDKVEIGLYHLQQALKARGGGVATLAEVQKEFKKRYSLDFQEEWRRNHFGHKDPASLDKSLAKHKIIISPCDGLLFRRKHPGETPQIITKPVEVKERMAPGESQVREALLACGGTAKLIELEKKFLEIHKKKFDKNWWKQHFQSKKLSILAKHPKFSSVVNAKMEQGTWILRLLPVVPTSILSDLTQLGLWQLANAVAFFPEGFCTCRQLRIAFVERLGLTFDTKWMRQYFGVENLDSVANIVAAKIRIWPKNEEKAEWYFQMKTDDSADSGVAQLLEVLAMNGGAATLDELEGVFREKFSSGCRLSWIKLLFDVDSFEKLSTVATFDRHIEMIPNPCFVFRQQHTDSEPPLADVPESIIQGRREILSVFDALDGECTMDEMVQEYGRQFHESLFTKKYFKRIDQLGQFMEQEVIIEKRPGMQAKLILANKEYEGRRRLLRVLKEAGDCCSLEELDRSYHQVFQSSWAAEMKKYFDVNTLEKAIPKMGNKIRTFRRKRLYVILRPDFSRLRKLTAEYKLTLKQSVNTYKEIFKHQGIFLGRYLIQAVDQLGKTSTLEDVCGYFTSLGGDYDGFAPFLKQTSPKLLKFMVPDMAWLFDRVNATPQPSSQTVAQSPSSGVPDVDVSSKAASLKQRKKKLKSQDTQSTASVRTPSSESLGVSFEGDSASTRVAGGFGCDTVSSTDSGVCLPQVNVGVLRVIRCLLSLKLSADGPNKPWSNEDELKERYHTLFGVSLDEGEMEKLFGVRSIAGAAKFLRYYVSVSEYPVYEERDEDVLVIKRAPQGLRLERVSGGEDNEMAAKGKIRFLEALDACPEGTATFEELKHSYHEVHGVPLDEEELEKYFGLSSVIQFIYFDDELHISVAIRTRKTLVGNGVQLEVLCDDVPLHLYSSAASPHSPPTA